MKEVPAYKKYPVSEEEMGKRYKNWTESLGIQMAMMYKVGKEVGGDEFVEKLKEAYRALGKSLVPLFMKQSGTKPEDFKDCIGLGKLIDTIDDSLANFWDGYEENSPKAFEKKILTCPLTDAWSSEPDLCAVMLHEMFGGVLETLNPKFKSDGFKKLLVRGDTCCHYRMELEED